MSHSDTFFRSRMEPRERRETKSYERTTEVIKGRASSDNGADVTQLGRPGLVSLESSRRGV